MAGQLRKFVTTSWDDGSPTDIRLAELLGKYGLAGTFYVPRFNEEHPVMTEAQITGIGRHFEIGGHTLNHLRLSGLSREQAEFEVNVCFHWLANLLGREPVSFCPPYGSFTPENLFTIRQSGFRIIRTTELLSTRIQQEIAPTTLQVFEHERLTYIFHLLKRGRFLNLAQWAAGGCPVSLDRLVDHYLDFIEIHGGCLHIWGHSWEIEEMDYWNKLEGMFRKITARKEFKHIKNMELATVQL